MILETLYKIIGIALITCVSFIIIKPIRNDFAIIISVVGGVIITFYIFSYMNGIFDIFNGIFKITGVNGSIYAIILKIIGIAYLTEFTANVCSDTGNASLGDKVLLGGKIIILVMALPIVTGILNIVMELLP